jgi:hypothetical protein
MWLGSTFSPMSRRSQPSGGRALYIMAGYETLAGIGILLSILVSSFSIERAYLEAIFGIAFGGDSKSLDKQI